MVSLKGRRAFSGFEMYVKNHANSTFCCSIYFTGSRLGSTETAGATNSRPLSMRQRSSRSSDCTSYARGNSGWYCCPSLVRRRKIDARRGVDATTGTRLFKTPPNNRDKVSGTICNFLGLCSIVQPNSGRSPNELTCWACVTCNVRPAWPVTHAK